MQRWLLLLLALCTSRLLAGRGVSAQVPDELAELLRLTAPTAEEAARFWGLAESRTRLTSLPSDESLPFLRGNQRSVAICVAGGARSFPLLDTGIARSIKENVVDALGATRTDVYYVMDTTNSHPPGKGEAGRSRRGGLRERAFCAVVAHLQALRCSASLCLAQAAYTIPACRT